MPRAQTSPPQTSPAEPALPEGPSLEHLRGPVEIPPLEFWQILALGLAGCFLLWLLYRFLRSRRNARSPRLTAADTAFAELDAAAQHTAGDDERFAVLSSLALRRYFERGHGIPALGRTTVEFLRQLHKHPKLGEAAREPLAEFLDRCDRVKFARHSLTPEEREALTENARRILHQCERPPGDAETGGSSTRPIQNAPART